MSENTLLPLSHAQQGLWMTYKENSKSTAYNTTLPLQFTQAIKIEALQQAVEQLMTYHPALRTCFSECDGVPYQQFSTKITDYWQCVDASQWDEKELTKQLFQVSQQGC